MAAPEYSGAFAYLPPKPPKWGALNVAWQNGWIICDDLRDLRETIGKAIIALKALEALEAIDSSIILETA